MAGVSTAAEPAAEPVAPADRRPEQPEADVTTLKRGTDGSASPAPDLHDLEARVDALRGAVEELARRAAVTEDGTGRGGGTEDRVSAVERELATIRAALILPSSHGAQSVAPVAQPTAEPTALQASLRDGFVLSTRGGEFALRASAFLQVEYLGTKSEDSREPAQSGLWLRRARLEWSGSALSPRVQYLLSLEAGGNRVQLYEAFVDLMATPSWRLRVGQFKVPFSRSWIVSARRLAFAERSIATEEYRYDRDVGVMIAGRVLDDRLRLYLAGFNGAGPNVFGNDNLDPVLVARVVGALAGRLAEDQEGDWERSARPSLSLGAGATLDYVPMPAAYGYRFTTTPPLGATRFTETQRDVDGDGRVDGVRVFQAGADLVARWKGFELAAELYLRNESWARTGQGAVSTFQPESSFAGGYVYGSYVLARPRMLIGLRYARTEVSPLTVGGRQRPQTTCPQAGATPFTCNLPYADSRSELSLAIDWAPFAHNLKLSLMGTYLRWSTSSDLANLGLPEKSRDARVVMQLQMGF